jgi:hypothetical protein
MNLHFHDGQPLDVRCPAQSDSRQGQNATPRPFGEVDANCAEELSAAFACEDVAHGCCQGCFHFLHVRLVPVQFSMHGGGPDAVQAAGGDQVEQAGVPADVQGQTVIADPVLRARPMEAILRSPIQTPGRPGLAAWRAVRRQPGCGWRPLPDRRPTAQTSGPPVQAQDGVDHQLAGIMAGDAPASGSLNKGCRAGPGFRTGNKKMLRDRCCGPG